MGFGISNVIGKATKAALIRYIDKDDRASAISKYGAETVEQLEATNKKVVGAVGYLAGAISNLLTEILITSIRPDVKVSETHKYSNEVTQQTLETGANAAEHIINMPIEVSLQFEETNNTFLLFSTHKYGEKLLGIKSTFTKLVDIWENKINCQIVTEHRVYNNMVIKNMPILHRAPYKKSLQVVCDFIQLNFANTEGTTYISSDKGTSKSASSTKSGGKQKLKSV